MERALSCSGGGWGVGGGGCDSSELEGEKRWDAEGLEEGETDGKELIV